MKHNGKTFANQRVELDGNEFVSCVFNDCEMVYAGGQPPVLDSCSFANPKFTFTGAASNTLSFIRAMYTGGFKPIVDGTIDSIRGGALDKAPGDTIVH